MKIDRLFNKGITGMLALAGILCGCAEEDYEASQTVPLSISATYPVLAGDVATRATTTEVKIALNATAGGYAATAKTYQVTSLSPSITFTPKDADNTWEVTGNLTSTPLTIYGWLDENTPVACSENSIAVNNGNISAVALSPAYACIGVRILLGKDTEAAGIYTINSSLKGIGTASTNNNWNTSGAMPVLNAASSSPGSINNTDKSTVVGINADDLTTDYFMRVAPTTIQASTANLFTITLPNGQQLPIASGNQTITIESGNCYLFTVNIGSETSLTISSIEQMTMDLEDYIVLHPQGVVPRKVGIFTKYDWDQFINDYSNGSYDNWLDSKDVLNLYTDIDLENEPFMFPLGEYPFSFNGHGYTISNLHVTSAGTKEGAGFYGYLPQGCTIQGLTIDGVTINSNSYYDPVSYAGAIVGYQETGSSIIDCHVKGKVTIIATQGGSYAPGSVGGIVGGSDGMVYACTFNPDESSTISGVQMGGIAGVAGTILGCIAHDFDFSWDYYVQSTGGIYAATSNSYDIYSCVAYNITANGGSGEIIGSDRNFYCYGYNVCGNSSVDDANYGSFTIGSLDDLSASHIINFLNQGISELGTPFPFHFEASPTSDITGPTIKPGAAY